MKDKTIDYVLRTTWLSVQKMYNEEAAKYNTTMSSAFTLLSVDPVKGTPSTALGPKMGIEATSLSRMLNYLEDNGLVERVPNPEDGRGVLIRLTEMGLKKREQAKNLVFIFNDAVKKVVSEVQLKHFHEVNNEIIKLINNKTIF